MHSPPVMHAPCHACPPPHTQPHHTCPPPPCTSPPPWTDFLTHACKNITNFVVGGKYYCSKPFINFQNASGHHCYLIAIITTRKRSLGGEVMFSHLSVILFTGGSAQHPPWMQTTSPPGCGHPHWMQTPSPWMQTPLPADADPLHMVNKWAVRILL